MQRPAHPAGGPLGIARAGLGDRGIGRERDEGVELRIDRADAVEIDARQPLAGERAGKRSSATARRPRHKRFRRRRAAAAARAGGQADRIGLRRIASPGQPRIEAEGRLQRQRARHPAHRLDRRDLRGDLRGDAGQRIFREVHRVELLRRAQRRGVDRLPGVSGARGCSGTRGGGARPSAMICRRSMGFLPAQAHASAIRPRASSSAASPGGMRRASAASNTSASVAAIASTRRTTSAASHPRCSAATLMIPPALTT